MKVIEVRPSKKFKGTWVACEAPGVGPAFKTADSRADAIDYAKGRFGGSAGEIHVYDDAATAIVEKIPIDGRGQYVQGQWAVSRPDYGGPEGLLAQLRGNFWPWKICLDKLKANGAI